MQFSSRYSGNNLPINDSIAVYYRQSRQIQVGNYSTNWQLFDLPNYLRQLGWADDKIIIISEDGAKSGNLGIDVRAGMSRLFNLIQTSSIRAVACTHEDRLFRDISQINVNRFIEACYVSNVIIITPETTYDFCHPTRGDTDITNFRFRAEVAAEYIYTVIRGRIALAKDRMASEGRWIGGNIPVGFIVDQRKCLPNGQRNENRNKFVLFEPYSRIVQQYFRIFVENGGRLRMTAKQIAASGPYYPDSQSPEVLLFVPSGHRFQLPVKMKPKLNGLLYPTPHGLRSIFTNAVYLGHWVWKNRIIVWNNHDPVVPESLFLTAFNYLSDVTLEGYSNTDSRTKRVLTSKNLSAHATERPVFEEIVFAQVEDHYRQAKVHWKTSTKQYYYVLTDFEQVQVWSRNAKAFDLSLQKELIEKLETTFRMQNFGEMLTDVDYIRAQVLYQFAHDIDTLSKSLKDTSENLSLVTDPHLRSELNEFLRSAENDRAMLGQTSTKIADRIVVDDYAITFYERYKGYTQDWSCLTTVQRKEIARVFIRRIEVIPTLSELRVTIFWKDDTTSKVTTPLERGVGECWTQEATERLLALAESGASQIVIASTYPHRTWKQIKYKLNRTTSKRYRFINLIRHNETFHDYLMHAQENMKSTKGTQWIPQELSLLEMLVESGANRDSICQALPQRSWRAIVKKLKQRGLQMTLKNFRNVETKVLPSIVTVTKDEVIPLRLSKVVITSLIENADR